MLVIEVVACDGCSVEVVQCLGFVGNNEESGTFDSRKICIWRLCVHQALVEIGLRGVALCGYLCYVRLSCELHDFEPFEVVDERFLQRHRVKFHRKVMQYPVTI